MSTAVCVVDMLNPYDHEDADRLTRSVEDVVEPIAALVERATSEGAEVIYVNDNHGDWNSSQEELSERAMGGRRPDLAYVRHLRVTVPPDGVAHIHEDLAGAALGMMERNMRAELTACAECELEA
jgi:nicotinamidase-related amidase